MIARTLPLVALLACSTEVDRPWTPHADAAAELDSALPAEGMLPPPYTSLRPPGDTPDVTVYGYWPYWGDPLAELPWDQLTHVAIFDVGLNADGSLSSTSRWTNNASTALALGAPWGVKVHLCVTSFSDSVMNTVLPSPALRATAISNLAALVAAEGAHGVNVDFEGMDLSQKANLVSFITELKAAVGEVYLATPAIDWLGAYDYDLLALGSDGVFIMGYGYHWSGGDPGPGAPLFGSATWGPYSLDWSVNDYRTWGAPDDRIVLGLPLYGRRWSTTDNGIPGTSTGSSNAEVFTAARSLGATYGANYDAASETMYTFPSGTSQVWYDSAATLETKIAWAISEGIQGVGFWAMTYEDADPELWNRIDALTHPGPSLGLPDPGLAAGSNTMTVRGATPGSLVHLAASTQAGTTGVPGCPTTVALRDPIYLGGVNANAAGEATFSIAPTPAASGRTVRFQAADATSCAVSNELTFSFP